MTPWDLFLYCIAAMAGTLGPCTLVCIILFVLLAIAVAKS